MSMSKNARQYRMYHCYDRGILFELLNFAHSDSQEVWNSRFIGKNVSFLGTNISQTEDEIIINRLILSFFHYVTYDDDDSWIDDFEFVLIKPQKASVARFPTNEEIQVDGIIRASEKIMNSNNSPILRIYLENSSVELGPRGVGYGL
jgi:hypothetical protein